MRFSYPFLYQEEASQQGGHMNVLLIALGLMMIFEGIPLFCFPDQLKELARKLPELENSVLRFIGLTVMMLGLGVVYLGKVVIGSD